MSEVPLHHLVPPASSHGLQKLFCSLHYGRSIQFADFAWVDPPRHAQGKSRPALSHSSNARAAGSSFWEYTPVSSQSGHPTRVCIPRISSLRMPMFHSRFGSEESKPALTGPDSFNGKVGGGRWLRVTFQHEQISALRAVRGVEYNLLRFLI
jgi:hypothetical protein